MRDSLRMVLVLSIIAMISAVVLSQVYNVTSVIIAENTAREMESAVYRVLPDVDSVEFIDAEMVLFAAKDQSGSIIGYAFASEAVGYAGPVRIMVGVEAETNAISDLVVLEHSETPGLGSRIEDADFRSRFHGKTTESAIRIGVDIDNISGATVSAEAVAAAVRVNFEAAVEAFEGGI